MNIETATARCWAEVDLSALLSNFDAAQTRTGGKVIPVLKADAYGLGAVKVAETLRSLRGVNFFAVAAHSEALELKRALPCDVLVMGMTGEAELAEAIRNDEILTVYSLSAAQKISETARALRKTARGHVKIDTGLHRLGFDPDDADIAKAASLPNLQIEAAYTHLALRSDAEDARQFERFERALTSLPKGIKTHMLDSIGMIRYPAQVRDGVRAGAWLYGNSPRDCPEAERPLPTVRFMTRVAQTRLVPVGECLGYDDEHPLARASEIATLSAGYVDGYPRLSGVGCVEIRGKRCAVAGLVCMDQMMVDATGANARAGDPVTLLGDSISLYEYADWAHLNRNEATARLSRRVPRLYYLDGKLVDIRWAMND